MKRPLVVLVIFYCLGIILANLMRFSFWVIMGIGIVIFAATILLRIRNRIFPVMMLFLTLLAGALSLKNSCVLPKYHINNFVLYKDNSLYSLRGFIDSVPELEDNHTQFIFSAQEIQKDKLRWRCRGKVLIKLDFVRELNPDFALGFEENGLTLCQDKACEQKNRRRIQCNTPRTLLRAKRSIGKELETFYQNPNANSGLHYGDNLTLIGNLSRPHNFKAASQGYKDFLARQEIYLIMRIKDPRKIIRQYGNSGSKLISNSFWLRAKMEAVISRNLAILPASILSAMVLGQKSGIPWLVNNSMVRSGTVHILVVSGFNVGIVAFIINLLLRILRFRRKARIILAVICLLIYCLITGASNPVVRATVMGIVFLTAYLLKRKPDMYNSMAIAALFILIINPGQLFDIGFQLSFISVLAIVYLYPKLEALIHLEGCRYKIWRFICQGCLVSFSAWLGTLGIIAFNFGIIAPVTVLANILIVPLATLITLCGFTFVLSGLIYPGLASLISVPTSMLINLLLNINAAIIKLPFAYIYL